MTKAIYSGDIQSKPDFVGLMKLYGNNYRLLTALLECSDDTENLIRNRAGYTLRISKKYQSRYTQNLELHYSFHTQKRGRKIVIAIASFKVRLYLDTRQAAVTFGEIELKKPFPIYGLCLSLRAKWFYNCCLGAVLRSFFRLGNGVS